MKNAKKKLLLPLFSLNYWETEWSLPMYKMDTLVEQAGSVMNTGDLAFLSYGQPETSSNIKDAKLCKVLTISRLEQHTSYLYFTLS